MKRFTLLFLAVCSFSTLIFSCMSDEEYAESVISEGDVRYKDSEYNIDNFYHLSYADFYKIESTSKGDHYAIVLSQNYISPGTSMTDAYIYCVIFNPKSESVFGTYQQRYEYPEKSIDFFAYYDTGVNLIGGSPVSYAGFYTDITSLKGGYISIKQLTEDKYRFYISFGDGWGKMDLTASFSGYLRYRF